MQISNKQVLSSLNFSGREFNIGIMSTPTTMASVFAKIQAKVGEAPEYGGGIIWRPSYILKEKTENVLQATNNEYVDKNIGTRRDTIRRSRKPKPNDTQGPILGGKWKDNDSYVKSVIKLESAIRLYAKQKNNENIIGTHTSLNFNSFFGEVIGEVNMRTGNLTRSDLGFSWVLQQNTNQEYSKNIKQAVGNLEVSCVLNNVSNLFETDPNVFFHPNEKPQATISFYKHLVIPRRILLATNYRYKLISNYIDIAFKLGFNPKDFTDSFSHNNDENKELLSVPLNMGVAATWQLNKNNLLKFKIDNTDVTFSHTFKAWWQPRFCFTTSLGHDFTTKEPIVGFWVVLDTSDKLEHEVAHSTYSDTVGTSVVDYIAEEDSEYV